MSKQIDEAWVDGPVPPCRVTVTIMPPHPVYGAACYEDEGELWAGQAHGTAVRVAYDLAALEHELQHVQGYDVQ